MDRNEIDAMLNAILAAASVRQHVAEWTDLRECFPEESERDRWDAMLAWVADQGLQYGATVHETPRGLPWRATVRLWTS